MTVNVFKRMVSRSLLLTVAVVAAGLLLAGCLGEGEGDSSTSSQSQQRQTEPGQMSQPGAPQPLSPSEIGDEQLQTAARIAVSVQMSTQQDRMKMQKEMQAKYGNPQQMDSTEKAQAQKEIRRRQMELQKKQMKIMQQQAEKEGMDPQRFREIMRSAQQDSTLRTKLQQAMKEQMREQQSQRMPAPNQQNP